MPSDGTRWWGVLQRWSAEAFLVAGGLFVIFAGLWGAFAFTTMTSEAAQNVVGPAGWTAAFVGLLGLYRRLADSSGHLATIGVVLAGIGCVGGIVTTVGNLGTLLGGVWSLPAGFEAVQLLLLIGIVPGFLTFAALVVQQPDEPRGLGLLLALPAGLFTVNIVRVATLGSTTPIWSPFVLGAGQALALLAIGYTEHSTRVRPDRPTPTADSAPEGS